MNQKEKGIIQRLKDKYDAKRAERAAKEELERPYKERIEAIFSAPRYTTTDFWCNTCKRDCSGTGYRQVCTLRSYAPTAWFTGFCPKGHKMLRRITDKDTDPYYNQSDMIRRHRAEMADDFLTPEDPRFQELYPEQYKALMAKPPSVK